MLRQLAAINDENPTGELTHILQTVRDANSDAPQSCFGNLENLLIDFDWRFDKPTAEQVHSLLKPFDSVLCLGTPTVFALLLSSKRQDFLVDQNPLYSEIFGSDARIAYASIETWNGAALGRRFDAVLLDPPWYLDSYFAWIGTALRLLKPGGTLFFPLFPRLLRESAQWEISVLNAFLVSLGAVSVASFRLRYETPSFEREYFARLELPALDGWRTAQLLATRIPEPDRTAAAHTVHLHRDQWCRYRFGTAVVAVKDSCERSDAPPSSDGRVFFLDSVSKRDIRRSQITAISSRNVATHLHLGRALKIQLRIMQEQQASWLGTSDPLIEAISNAGYCYA